MMCRSVHLQQTTLVRETNETVHKCECYSGMQYCLSMQRERQSMLSWVRKDNLAPLEKNLNKDKDEPD